MVLAVGLAGTAQAAPFTPELEADYSAALAWWGVTSPPLCSSVTREVEPTDFQGEHAVARSTQPDPAGWGGACSMTVFEDGLANLRAIYGSGASCAIAITIRHEVGHLLGYGRSEDPTNIMHEPSPKTECIPALPPAPAATQPKGTVEEERERIGQYWAEWRKDRFRCKRRLRRHPKSICMRFVKAQAAQLRELSSESS